MTVEIMNDPNEEWQDKQPMVKAIVYGRLIKKKKMLRAENILDEIHERRKSIWK